MAISATPLRDSYHFGWRGDTSIEKRIEYDLYYLQNWSFTFDLRIIVMTISSGLINRNAY
jgi:lipopolysaccharide/colanic/teichoic acid biosynthesis glycosyltransferase